MTVDPPGRFVYVTNNAGLSRACNHPNLLFLPFPSILMIFPKSGAWVRFPSPAPYLTALLTGPQFDVLQYHLNSLDSLRKKLSQFPLGSSFVWSEGSATPSAEAVKNFVEPSQFLKAHGMSLRNETVP